MSALIKFLHTPSVPLRLRKKVGKLVPVAAGRHFEARMFENIYRGITGNHLDDKTFLYGMHEAATIRFMRGVLTLQRQEGLSPTYMDIGTNTGAHLLGVASLADRSLGFEPWGPVRALAQANVVRNDLAHVTIFDCGLGNADAALPFAPPVDANHGTGSFYRTADATGTIPVRRGDSLLAELGVTPTLVKIDTEGFERPILEGLHETLRRAVPVVVFEYSAMSRPDFANDASMDTLFGDGYLFYGLCRSREFPKVEPFRPGKRYENLIAWPKTAPPITRALGR